MRGGRRECPGEGWHECIRVSYLGVTTEMCKTLPVALTQVHFFLDWRCHRVPWGGEESGFLHLRGKLEKL